MPNVFIEITELRAISSDRRNWMLMKRTKKTDKKTGKPTGGYSKWSSYYYPNTFKKAAVELENELVKCCGAGSFAELHRLADHIHDNMTETLKLAELPNEKESST